MSPTRRKEGQIITGMHRVQIKIEQDIGKSAGATHPLNHGKLMSVIPVGTVIAHSKLCHVPVARGSHHWCQSPGDSSSILPLECTLVLIPGDFNRVPVIMIDTTVKVVVNVIEARDPIYEGIIATAGCFST